MGKRQVKNESELKEIRIPEEGELFGRVLKMLGGENVMVKCTDGITRRGRIRGKLKRRVWIRDNDIVIIAPWDFKNSEMGDIVWRFTLPQVDWLKQNDITGVQTEGSPLDALAKTIPTVDPDLVRKRLYGPA